MEMESSRRSSIDRSCDLPGLKKPRLADDSADRDRAVNGGLPSRASAAQVNPRIRANEREREERDDAGRGPAPTYQQQQELVARYKAALSELTFNSKPIITNLSIIAGESLHAAKGIAATICNNILEVPSEQKLPSLYLLDSIVKNIGRDYIKYFAARLPEVFCRAYKQVDPSIHPGMRHLFGTWKGVFPAAPLQIIEKELGFPPVVNGTSGSSASRSGSQTQRPAHSIHVNPKYLEARQRLQQTRAKEMNSEDSGDMDTSVDDVERPEKTAISGSTRQWTDLSSKNIQRPERGLSHDPIYEKKGSIDIRDHQFSSLQARESVFSVGRIGERTREPDEYESSKYGVGAAVPEMLSSRRNGYDAKNPYGDFRTSGFMPTDPRQPSAHLNSRNKSVQATSKNWKNSEEEEYMWDDMDSKMTDFRVNNISLDFKRAPMQSGLRMPLESEQPDLIRDKLDNFPRLKSSLGEDPVPSFRDMDNDHLKPHSQLDAESRRHMETSADLLSVGRAASGHHASTLWPPRDPLLPVPGLNQISSRFPGQSEVAAGSTRSSASLLERPGSHSLTHPSTLGIGQNRQQSLQPPPLSTHPPPPFQNPQLPKLHSAIDHDTHQSSFLHMDQKSMQLPGHLNRVPHSTLMQDSSSGLVQNQNHQSQRLLNLPQLPSSQPSSTPFTQLRPHLPFPSQSQPELPSTSLNHSDKLKTSAQDPRTQPHRFSSEILSTKSIDVSGSSSTSNLLATIMKSGLLTSNPTTALQSFSVPPPLPSGPPPIQAFTSSVPMAVPSLATPATGVMLPPLPPGPPPSTLASAPSQKPDPAISMSSLLSTLVAKGILSSPAPELLTKLPDQSIGASAGTSVQLPSMQLPSTSDNLTVPPVEEPAVLESSASAGVASLASDATELEDLLGVDFKPDIIRELQPSVISSLFDDLKLQCDLCGLRFRLQHQLQSHSDLHTREKSNEVSRHWYSDISSWVAGDSEPQVLVPTTSLEDVGPMVPADERQSICAFCGELFEDFYSHERGEWMYKGTVYLTSSENNAVGGIPENNEEVPIVHAKCISRSADDENATQSDKMAWTDG